DELRLPPSPRSIAEARRFVAHATGGEYAHLSEVACLVVSELATNAVHYGRTDYVVCVETLADRVRVTVQDEGGGVPVRREPGPAEVRGRGLQIVQALVDSWGVLPAKGSAGKTVWFELLTARH
ncbi:MAG: ATP-binding protein, partial [Acidimicrobiales bacterium]